MAQDPLNRTLDHLVFEGFQAALQGPWNLITMVQKCPRLIQKNPNDFRVSQSVPIPLSEFLTGFWRSIWRTYSRSSYSWRPRRWFKRKLFCPLLKVFRIKHSLNSAQYEHAWICMNRVSVPGRYMDRGSLDTHIWSLWPKTLPAWLQKAGCIIWTPCYPNEKDPNKMALFLDHFGARRNTKTHVGEKEHGEHNLCPCTQRSNPHFSSSFDNRRVSASNTTCVRKPKAFSTPTCCLFWLQVQGTTGPWTRPASTNERRRLHRSTPLQIKASSTWKPLEQRKKKHNWAPGAKMFPIHTDLIHSSSYQICPDQAEVELLEPQASGPIPQTAGLKGKKRQLYRAVEVWKLEVSSTEKVMLLWWLTPWKQGYSYGNGFSPCWIASILSVLE